jgi:hypothetical protein
VSGTQEACAEHVAEALRGAGERVQCRYLFVRVCMCMCLVYVYVYVHVHVCSYVSMCTCVCTCTWSFCLYACFLTWCAIGNITRPNPVARNTPCYTDIFDSIHTYISKHGPTHTHIHSCTYLQKYGPPHSKTRSLTAWKTTESSSSSSAHMRHSARAAPQDIRAALPR